MDRPSSATLPLFSIVWPEAPRAGSAAGSFFSQDMADYYTHFILAAKKAHGVDISYVGVWNERNFNAEWIKLFRKTLDAAGLQQTGILGAETFGWGIVSAIMNDPDLAKSIAVIGVHYPKTKSSPEAKNCGKTLWSSEDGPWSGGWGGTRTLAMTYNRNYIVGKIVATEIWSPVTSYYDIFPLSGSGVMKANTPWSGAYEVQPAVWGTAHTTQFAQPGWVYMDSGCTLLNGVGSVVALHSRNDADFSLVLKTFTTTKPRTIVFQLKGPRTTKPIHVWRTTEIESFIQQPDLPVANGILTLNAEPGAIYSVTTLTTPHKGDAAPPPSAPFALPYKEDFYSYAVGAAPKYWSDFGGAFEVVKRADGQGQALRQVIAHDGITWNPDPFPETLIGDRSWTDSSITTDVMVEGDGIASLFGRVSGCAENDNSPRGVWLKVGTNGQWALTQRISQKTTDPAIGREKRVDIDTVIGHGASSFPPNRWQQLGLSFKGDQVSVSINGADIGSAHTDCVSGLMGIGCGWHGAQFDNITIH